MPVAKRQPARKPPATTEVRSWNGTHSETVSVESKSFGSAADRRSMTREQLTTLREFRRAFLKAQEEARRTGTGVRIIVEVPPRRHAVITTIPAASKPATADAALQDALAAARERGSRRVAEILNGPDMLSADAFAQLMGVTRATVNTRRQNRHLLGLEGAKRGFRFPAWQLDEDCQTLAALPELFERLGDSPWAVYRFLVQHHAEIDGLTGLQALRQDQTDQALAAADNAAQAFA